MLRLKDSSRVVSYETDFLRIGKDGLHQSYKIERA